MQKYGYSSLFLVQKLTLFFVWRTVYLHYILCRNKKKKYINKSWGQYPIKQQLYGHESPISKTVQIRRKIHAGHCGRRKDKLISDVLQWIPILGRASIWLPAGTYQQQLRTDTGCRLKHLLEAMDDSDEWRERVREIHESDTTWWCGLMSKVFANGPEDRGSILGQVIPKTQKWSLMPPPSLALNIIRHRSIVKWSNPRKGVAPSSTIRCSSYWKGSLLVTLD